MKLFLELHVQDFANTEKFYNVLGFKKIWRNTKHNGYMVMQNNDAILQFYGGNTKSHSFFQYFSQHQELGLGVEVCLSYDGDIERLFEKIRSFLEQNPRCGKIVANISKRAWDLTDFRVTDPSGYYLRITEAYEPLTER